MDSGSDRLSENVGFHGSVNHQNSFLELRPNGAKIAGVMRQDCGGYAHNNKFASSRSDHRGPPKNQISATNVNMYTVMKKFKNTHCVSNHRICQKNVKSSLLWRSKNVHSG